MYEYVFVLINAGVYFSSPHLKGGPTEDNNVIYIADMIPTIVNKALKKDIQSEKECHKFFLGREDN